MNIEGGLVEEDVRANKNEQPLIAKKETLSFTWLRKVVGAFFGFTSIKPSSSLHTFEHERREWETFYEVVFGVDCDFSNLPIPEKPSDEFILEIVLEGLTCNCIFEQWNFPKFKCNSQNGDIDGLIAKNIRSTKRSYAIWVRNSQEADDEDLVAQFRQSIKGPRSGMTLLERMLLESKYYFDNKLHLDVKGSTLCSGSMFKDGKKPHVFYGTNGKVRVHHCDRDGSPHGKGIRVVVSE